MQFSGSSILAANYSGRTSQNSNLIRNSSSITVKWYSKADSDPRTHYVGQGTPYPASPAGRGNVSNSGSLKYAETTRRGRVIEISTAGSNHANQDPGRRFATRAQDSVTHGGANLPPSQDTRPL